MAWLSSILVVELRFRPDVARRVKETTWHESQEAEDQPDGSLRVRLVVAEPTELKHWVLGWGSACEVISPQDFREQLAQEAAAMAGLYARAGSAARRAG